MTTPSTKMFMQVLLMASAALAADQPAARHSGAPSFTARAYFMEARRLYRTAEYAAGTNSVIHKY